MPSLPGTPPQKQERFNPNVTNQSAMTCDLTSEDLAVAITLQREKIRIADGLLVERRCQRADEDALVLAQREALKIARKVQRDASREY
ncbi:uncharacterized protein PAC_19020 [Phialocephala subalpina]|uniref:Uncharacterized protein n=1 Tax=Phialocephala subalpina TaxID=576137 RepID=A0A1L7XVU8_9HELO|nr:uncharacterized protein PAC_19020 [Phialocephala subalpina]